MIEKTIPSNEIIQLLKKELKDVEISDHLKNIINQTRNVSLNAFNEFCKSTSNVFNSELKERTETPSTYDHSLILSSNYAQSSNLIKVKEILNADGITNSMVYPPKSLMHWHTNGDNPGKRTYIIYTKNPGIFRYRNIETGEIIDDYDNVGWTQRSFMTPMWHCVWANGVRFSFGFNTINND